MRHLGREKERVGWKEKEGGSKIDSAVQLEIPPTFA